jgi:SPOR domain
MFKKIQFIIYTIVMVNSMSIYGQKLIKKAEMQAENGDFHLAVDSYRKYLSDNSKDYLIMSKLAESLTLAGELDDANELYENITKNTFIDANLYKKHGDLLKKLGMYEEAKASYLTYSTYVPDEGQHYLKSIEFAIKTQSKSADYETFVMPSNSSVSDFGLTFYKDQPVFSSFRNDVLMTEEVRISSTYEIAHKSFLYNAKKNRLGFIKNIDGNINHIGPLSFSANGTSCAIIESKIKDSYSFVTADKISKLYIATLNDKGEVTASKPFLYNEVGSSINSAHMAFDGSAIYFSSNRQGGYGGYDIYVSYLNDGKWSLPVNLGKEINTGGNEITPFLQGNELYFASDFHIGIGGYDIVKSKVENGVWTKVLNVGTGVNSINDEYFPSFNRMGELYITSNRLGGRGGNDIYKTRKINTQTQEEIYSSVPQAVSLDAIAAETQKHTGNPELGAMVSMKGSNTESAEKTSSPIAEERAFKLPVFDTKTVGNAESDDSYFVGAHRIALDQAIPNTEVFFIQLASMSSVKPNFKRFKSLVKFGNIYKMHNGSSIKVRLGYFDSREEAENVLAKVRASGFQDAFITFEMLNTAKMELILTSSDADSFTDEGNFHSKNPTEEMRNFKSGNKYKVRLASYEDPIWFDVEKVKDLGRIEQWTKGGWTIFILAGYNNLEEAKTALVSAQNRGFKTAEVVIDNGGILERLKQN